MGVQRPSKDTLKLKLMLMGDWLRSRVIRCLARDQGRSDQAKQLAAEEKRERETRRHLAVLGREIAALSKLVQQAIAGPMQSAAATVGA